MGNSLPRFKALAAREVCGSHSNKSHELFAFRPAMEIQGKVCFFGSICISPQYPESDTPKALRFQ